MRSVVFVVVIVLWAVIEINGEYSFGDIISFQRNCPCIRPLTYKHFAIYVGNKEIKYKESDKDIFQRTGPVKPFSLRRLSDCIFSKLEDERQPSIFGGMNVEKKDNYLDGFANFTVGSEDQIIERITETHKNCSQYEPRSNNCEHLATYIRYGEKLSLQTGMFAERYCRNPNVCNEVKRRIEEIKLSEENQKKCNTCTVSSDTIG
ncbi:hypothetical protein EXN66_Car008038 [Channa argus]|uniref:LRAT domain-containing protein n=1 Tax=Channa argus TaxID=215402 RepID=A0A6G1PQ16_CHAAH|nr:hypothetical protein EXN66_Car008038 [Channa argus]